MQIITWNCNGALRKKRNALADLDADLCIVQECEDPSRCADREYRSWAKNSLWIGASKDRGLGVFAKPGIRLEQVQLQSGALESFLPCKVDGHISLLAVWTRKANSPTFGYIGQLWKFLQLHDQFLNADRAALIGDLNSNARWDVWDRWWNHSDVVRQLQGLGLSSLYHHARNEAHGQESTPTFYLYRHSDRPHHIDYAFLSQELLADATLAIGSPTVWLELSDHLPLVITLR